MFKKRGKLLIVGIPIITTCIGLLVWSLAGRSGGTIGTINGISVVREEYVQVMSQNIANITSRYAAEYEKGTPEEFWGTSREEKEPLKELRAKTQEDLTKRYVLLALAKEYGLMEKIDYVSLKKALEAENKHRADPNRTEPIYGPNQYDFSEYITYLQANLKTELIPILQEKGVISVTEKETLQAYQESPFLLGATNPSYKFLEAQRKLESGKEPTKQELAEVTDALENGTAMPKGWSVSEHTIDEDNYREVSRMEVEKTGILSSLSAGEVSHSVIVGDTCYIMKMLDRREEEPLPYEEIKGLYQKKLAEEKLEQLLQEQCDQAVVVWKDAKLPSP